MMVADNLRVFGRSVSSGLKLLFFCGCAKSDPNFECQILITLESRFTKIKSLQGASKMMHPL